MSAIKMPNLALIVISLGIVCFGSQPMALAAEDNKSSSKIKLADNATQHEGDSAGVRAQIAALAKALGDGDAKTVAAMWSEDGDYIDEDGGVTKGRTALEKRFSVLFTQNGKQLVDLLPDSVRFISADVALTEGTVKRKDGASKAETRFSMVFSKHNGVWQISSATETALTVDNSVDPLKDLSWLVGD